MKKALSEVTSYVKSAPLLWAALFFIAGAAAAVKMYRFPLESNFFGPLVPTYAIAVILFTIICSAAILFGFKKRVYHIVLLSLFLFGFIISQATIDRGYKKEEIIEHSYVQGTVAKVEDNGKNSIALILEDAVVSGDAGIRQMKGRISLIVYGKDAAYLKSSLYVPGSVVGAETTLMYPTGAAEYGFMSERLDMLSKRIFYKALAHYAAIETVEENSVPIISGALYDIQKSVYGGFERYVGGDEADFARALLTGSKGSLDSDVKSDFSALGISHLLATSGLHIGILLLAFEYLFKKLRVPIVIRAAVSFLLIFLFLLFTGFKPSMMRACFMWSVLMASKISGERLNPINSLGGAALFMAILNPLCVYDISFVLSCLASAAIVLSTGVIGRLSTKAFENKAIQAVAVTLAIVLFTWPVVAYYFNSVSLLSFIYNIIFVPLSGAALFMSLILCIFSSVGFIAPVLGTAVKVLSFVILSFADFLAGFSPALKIVSPPFWAIISWTIGISLAIFSYLRKRKKAVIAAALAFLVLSLSLTIFSHVGTRNEKTIKLYSDGSVIFMYIQDADERALIMNDDSFIAYTVLKKQAAKELDMLIFTGNSADTLNTIAGDLGDVDIENIYAPQQIAKEYSAQYGEAIKDLEWLEFMGYNIETIEFKAKSKTAKTHYAAYMTKDGESMLYFDPLSLREGAFEGIDIGDVISSRWSKSRVNNLTVLDYETLYYSNYQGFYDMNLTPLEREGASAYNISGKAKIIYP